MHRLARSLGVLALAVTLVACSPEGNDDEQGAPTTSLPGVPAPAPADRFTLGPVEVQAVRPPPPPLPEPVRTAVLATLDGYLQRAVLAPLRDGSGPVDLASLFTGAAGARLTGPDRAVLADEGLGPARDVRVNHAGVGLSALAAGDGTVPVVVARVDLQVAGRGRAGGFQSHRSGELVLVPDGAWKIDGYDLRVVRGSGDGGTSTTAAHR